MIYVVYSTEDFRVKSWSTKNPPTIPSGYAVFPYSGSLDFGKRYRLLLSNGVPCGVSDFDPSIFSDLDYLKSETTVLFLECL